MVLLLLLFLNGSKHTLFFTLYDLDMTRQAQCPLWCLSETSCSSPAGAPAGDWMRRVSFGPFSFSERGDFIGSKLPVCLESWLCRESFRGWETRPLAQVTWTASDFENDTSKLVQICANSCRLRRKQTLNLIDRLSMSSFMSYSDNV